jgi:hypothetical protein
MPSYQRAQAHLLQEAAALLLKHLHDCASNLSFYNAAEGNWRKETDAREEARRLFQEARSKVDAKGLKYDLSAYLI